MVTAPAAPTPKTQKPGITGTALKRLACVSMLIDHIGASCLEAGVLPNLTDVQLFNTVYAVDNVLRLIGRLAFPIYCFLLVEGFLHTHDLRKYALRLLAFAFVSELPFNWAFFNTPFYWGHQNVYFTLFLGLVALALVRRLNTGRLLGALGQIGAVALCMGAAELLQTDYSATGVLLIVLLYALRRQRTIQCVAGAFAMSYEITAPLAFVSLWFYNGRRGHCSRAESLFYYAFYPAHLLVLACVTNLLLH